MKTRQRERARRIPVTEEVKSRIIRFRVTERDYQAIHKTAVKKGCTVSLLLVECLRSQVNGLV